MSRAWLPLILFLSVLLPALCAGPVLAVDLIPVSQDRHLDVSALAVDDNIPVSDQDADSSAAADFGSFVDNVSADAAVTRATGSSSSSQDSQILADSVLAVGSMSATAASFDYEAIGQADGESHCELTFDVTAAASFTLSGNVAASGTGDASVDLDGPGGTIVSVSAGANQTTPVLETGVLLPARYTLVIRASGSAYASYFITLDGSASYDLVLALAPAVGAPEREQTLRGDPVAAPNPFRESTRISLGGSGAVPIAASVYDVHGRLVRTLAGPAGGRTLGWDGTDRAGERVRPGVYLVRIQDGARAYALKVTRMR